MTPDTDKEVLRETVARLRALLAKATPGPWEQSCYDVRQCGKAEIVLSVDGPSDDAALIVEAVNALPALLAALTPSVASHEDGGWRRQAQELLPLFDVPPDTWSLEERHRLCAFLCTVAKPPVSIGDGGVDG